MTAAANRSEPDETRGLALGLAGVAMFALTLPMTRMAVGPLDDPQLAPLFVTAGRAAFAALPSIVWLLLTRAPRPRRDQWPAFIVCALGTVIGFPLGLALALREVPAMHAAVVTGVLPLGTAIAAAWHFRQRPSIGFWLCALAGAALVVVFALIASGGVLIAADGWLLFAVVCASIGYVAGATLAARMRAEHVICWVLVGSLPFTLPVTLATWPAAPVRIEAWGGFAYVALVSMWIGFFAWYRALAIGGTVRVSQVQLLQPFLALLAAVPILGEPLAPATLGFALAIVAVVFAGRSMPVGQKAES